MSAGLTYESLGDLEAPGMGREGSTLDSVVLLLG